MNLPVRHVRGFAELGRALDRLADFGDRLSAVGATPLEYQAMLVIKTCPGEQITITALARRLKLKKSFSVRLADRLTENDFAVRRASARAIDTVIELRPRGQEVLAALAARHLEELRAAQQILCGLAQPASGA